MPRTQRIRKAPNRVPVSLAAVATPSEENEVITTIEVSLEDNPSFAIDPSLTLDPSLADDDTSSTTILGYDSYSTIDLDLNYPLLPDIPDEDQQSLSTWSISPPPAQLPAQPPAQPPVQLPAKLAPTSHIRWTLEMESVLFATLLEQVDIGKRADSGFKKEAWVAVCSAIESTTGQSVTFEKCKGKVDSMKALWRELKWLRDQSGFGWNEDSGLVEAGTQAWIDIIKVTSYNTLNL